MKWREGRKETQTRNEEDSDLEMANPSIKLNK